MAVLAAAGPAARGGSRWPGWGDGGGTGTGSTASNGCLTSESRSWAGSLSRAPDRPAVHPRAAAATGTGGAAYW